MRLPKRQSLPFWQEFPLLLAIAFIIAIAIKTFLFQAFFIPSGSMENTLLVGDRVLVNKVVYTWRTPERGEVIVFRGSDSWAPEAKNTDKITVANKINNSFASLVGFSQLGEKDFVKRVIGTPGDTVACCDKQGRVTVNGHALDEPYIIDNNPLSARGFGPVTVPAGRLFVMGDHRGISADSREYLHDAWSGTIPIDHVIGKAFIVVWPLGRVEVLSTTQAIDSSAQ